MHRFIDKIKNLEEKPAIIKNFVNSEEISSFKKIFRDLPTEIHNYRQKILKKKWSSDFSPQFQSIYKNKLKAIMGSHELDNPKTKDGLESLGLFQESYSPVNLHVDAGYNFEKVIYKQTLLPLSSDGETVIFKNRYYGCATTFSIDPNELSAKGYNKRSSEHLKIFNGKDFDKDIHQKYLKHENINNLKGLEVDLIYKWKLGDILIFDRTSLHCSSSNLKGKKLGFTTLTAKL